MSQLDSQQDPDVEVCMVCYKVYTYLSTLEIDKAGELPINIIQDLAEENLESIRQKVTSLKSS